MQFPSSASSSSSITASSTICCFKYRTYMNTVSILDKICMWMLQQQNVKHDAIEKKITSTNTNVNASANSGSGVTNAQMSTPTAINAISTAINEIPSVINAIPSTTISDGIHTTMAYEQSEDMHLNWKNLELHIPAKFSAMHPIRTSGYIALNQEQTRVLKLKVEQVTKIRV